MKDNSNLGFLKARGVFELQSNTTGWVASTYVFSKVRMYLVNTRCSYLATRICKTSLAG